jgi:hypothetical protein
LAEQLPSWLCLLSEVTELGSSDGALEQFLFILKSIQCARALFKEALGLGTSG